MNEDDLKRVGELIGERRKQHYGTKSAAYQAAGLNAATWDRAEAGLPIREDRMTALLKALFGDGITSPESLLQRASSSLFEYRTRGLGPGLEDPDSNTSDLAAWAEENFRQINGALADLAGAIDDIKRKVGLEHGESSAQKSDGDDPEEGGATVTRLPRDPKPSDSDEILNPAALDTDKGVDEEPGGSDDD